MNLTAGEAHLALRSLPIGSLDEVLGGRSPLILAPHPDDESLGCGGLIAASVQAGLEPSILILTDGAASHPNSRRFPATRLRDIRHDEAIEAAKILGVPAGRVFFVDLPDSATPQHGPVFDTAVAAIVSAARRVGAEILLATWRHDPHWDHVTAHLMAVRAAEIAGLTHYAYPVWGWTLPDDALLDGPAPHGWRFDVTTHLPIKRAAVLAHRSQSTDMIDDDDHGFRLPDALLEAMLGPYEVILSIP